MKIWPVLNRVVVEVREVEEKTKGGIIIARTIKETMERRSDIGTLIDIGPHAFEDWGGADKVAGKGLNVGDTVLFTRQGGKAIEDEEGAISRFRVLNDTDIIAVLEYGEGD